jgi:hypothetical protein
MAGKIMSDNPLSGYFRRPAIYISLPSNGNYWPPGTLQPTETGELPVYPMTAVDDITYRTPDALFSGQAVVDVIQSCMPNIKNAWAIPTVDLDTILVSIRIASSGHTMEIDTTCPKCEEEARFDLDLRGVLEQIKIPDYTEQIAVGDLKVQFKPLNFKQLTNNNAIQYEEQRVLQAVANEELSEEERLKVVNAAFKKLSSLTVKAVTEGIHFIESPETRVDNPQHIAEFLQNCENAVFDSLKNKIVSLREQATLEPLQIKCPSCEHQYTQPFTLNMTDFFD